MIEYRKRILLIYVYYIRIQMNRIHFLREFKDLFKTINENSNWLNFIMLFIQDFANISNL